MSDFRSDIAVLLTKLHKANAVFFCLLCCKRLFPHYIHFSNYHNWGNTSIIKEGIRFIQGYISTRNFDSVLLQQLIHQVDSIIPDTTIFGTIHTSLALDAGSAVYESLCFIEDSKESRLLDVSIFCIDSVDMYIQEKEGYDYNDMYFEEKILRHPLMIQERQRQLHILEELAKSGVLGTEKQQELVEYNRSSPPLDITSLL